MERTLELVGAKDGDCCPCCHGVTRRVWGFVRNTDETEAAYFVEWTRDHAAQHGAYFDLVIGRWGERATPKDRVAVSLEFRRTERGPEFMVIDAAGRPVAASDLAGIALSRQAVLGTPITQQAFAIVDAIWLQDGRIGEITRGAT